MTAITLDPSKRVDIKYHSGTDGSKTFTFTDTAGDAYDISGFTFTMNIRRKIYGTTNTIQLTEGSGLTKSTSSLVFTLTDAQTAALAGDYYWELKRTDGSSLVKRWLNGYLQETKVFDGINESSSIVIDESGTAVTVTINESGSSLLELENGNGTTANGSAVDLGGTLTGDVTIDKDGNDFNITGTGDINIGSDYLNNSIYTSGGYIYQASDFASRLKHNTPSTGAGTWDLIHGITDGVSDEGFELSQNGAIRFRVPRVDGGNWQVNLGSDATGDIYYRNSIGKFTRLPAGTEGQVLTMRSGIPVWE